MKKFAANRGKKIKESKQSAKNKEICVFVLTMLPGNKSYTLGKPVYFPVSVATFIRKMHLWVTPMEKSAKSSLAKQLILLLTLVWCSLLHVRIEV